MIIDKVNVLEVNLENKNAIVETEVDNDILKNAIEECSDVVSIK